MFERVPSRFCTVALRDVAVSSPPFSLGPVPSYADNHVSLLKPPLTRTSRYTCLTSGDAALDASRG